MNEPKTPNLGLNKIDRSSPSTTYFDLDKYLDQNWEKIDDFAEQVEGKAGETAAQVSRIKERLDTEQRKSVTLEPGLQIINAERASAFKLEGLKGRTLVNLLGRDGNCESTARWLLFQGAVSTDPVNKTESSNGIKLTVTSGSFATGTALNTINAKANKFYIAVVDAKNGNATNASFYVNGLTATKGVNSTSDATKFVPLWRAYAPTSDVVASVIIQTNSSATGQFAYFDAVRFYEITAAEYTALDSMTPKQVAAKYPYVDSVTPVRNPYAIRYGENLLPPFYEYVPALSGTSTLYIRTPYEADLLTTATTQPWNTFIPIVAGETYTLSYESSDPATAYINLQWIDDYGSPLGYSPKNENGQTVQAPANAVRAKILVTAIAAGTFIFRNPMLTIGTTAKPFKPREDAMFALQTDLYADPVTGANADEVFERDGQYFKLAKWGHVIVNDKFTYEKLAGTETGYKQVYVLNLISPLPVTNGAFMTKYDGKILTRVEGNKTTADLFGIHSTAGTLYVTISNTDSGWGDSYTPTADEIKAYFMGWTMFNGAVGTGLDNSPDVPTNNVYNGTGTKWWARRSDGVARSWADATNTLPTTQAPYWTPYQLVYQLATATVEPVTSEGQLTFIEGNNQIEVGTGIVLREYAPITKNSPVAAAMNDSSYPSKYKVEKFIRAYKNGKYDPAWYASTLNPYGLEKARINWADFDETAAYSVTYLMLDTFQVAPFVGSLSDNEKALLMDLVEDVQQASARLSVVESKKAEKDVPAWITPTLLNGWINYSSAYQPIGYYKDSQGIVRLRGLISSGTSNTGTFVFNLPKGYRPKKAALFSVLTSNGTVLVPATLEIASNGVAYLGFAGGNVWLSLENISYQAEQ
jgi:hypothetical protein